MAPCMGAARGCVGAQQRRAAQGRGSRGLRRRAAAWGYAGAQQLGRSVGLHTGAAALGCAKVLYGAA